MAIETTIAETWIYHQLATDSTLTALIGGASDPRIYSDEAEQGAAFPYVVILLLSPQDVNTVNGTRVMTNLIYAVKAVDQVASYGGALATLAQRIDACLHKQSGAAAGGQVLSATRQQIIRMPEQANGVQYRHLGGQYRLFAQ